MSTTSVMLTGSLTVEDQHANLTKVIEGLATTVQNQDSPIAHLMNKKSGGKASHTNEKHVEEQEYVETLTKHLVAEREHT